MPYKLGRQPKTPDERDLMFSKYVDMSTVLPLIPPSFGFDHVVPVNAWGMLGNDAVGDCTCAAADHSTMVQYDRGVGEGKTPVSFNTQNALTLYSEVTGYDPSQTQPDGSNPTDNGAVMRDVMKYRKAYGLKDASGRTHKIGAYLSLDNTNLQEMAAALYIFEAVDLGFQFPASAMTQFNEGLPWSYVPGSQIEGGHAVTWAGKQGTSTFTVVTWGMLIKMTQEFWYHYGEEAWCYVSVDLLESNQKTYRGFDLATLTADLAAL